MFFVLPVIRITYKDFLAYYVNKLTPVPITTLPAVPEAHDSIPSDNAANPIVPRLSLPGVEFPPLEQDEEVLTLLQDL